MSTPITEAKFLVLDTETSGDDSTVHSPVEVGAVLTDLTKTLVAATSLVNPGHKITSEAKACHHIKDVEVADAPDLKTVLKTVVGPAVSGHVIDTYAAHNASFDSAMLPMLNKKPWLCTLKLAKKVVPGLRHYGNQFLRYELELDVPEAEGQQAHRALIHPRETPRRRPPRFLRSAGLPRGAQAQHGCPPTVLQRDRKRNRLAPAFKAIIPKVRPFAIHQFSLPQLVKPLDQPAQAIDVGGIAALLSNGPYALRPHQARGARPVCDFHRLQRRQVDTRQQVVRGGFPLFQVRAGKPSGPFERPDKSRQKNH